MTIYIAYFYNITSRQIINLLVYQEILRRVKLFVNDIKTLTVVKILET